MEHHLNLVAYLNNLRIVASVDTYSRSNSVYIVRINSGVKFQPVSRRGYLRSVFDEGSLKNQ
jgi:hypothetical protein